MAFSSSERGLLSASEVEVALKELSGWVFESERGSLRGEFRFVDFASCSGFVVQVWLLSERYDHHPILRQNYRKVACWWRSHDVGGVSFRDIRLARECGLLAERCGVLN